MNFLDYLQLFNLAAMILAFFAGIDTVLNSYYTNYVKPTN